MRWPVWSRGSALGLLVAAPLAAQQAGYSPGLIELHISKGPSRVVSALVRDSALLLPLGAIAELAEIRSTGLERGARWSAVLEPAGQPLIASTEGRFLRRREQAWALGDLDAAWEGDELYLSPASLERALDVSLDVDWTNLTVFIRGAEHLPVIRRLLRQQRRDRLLARSAGAVPAELAGDPTPVADGAVLDWALVSSLRDPLGTTGLDLAFGAGLAGGGLRIAHTERRTTIGRLARTRLAWSRAWPDQPIVRQVRLGETGATGPHSLRTVGVAVTNAPFLRGSDFGRVEVEGAVPPGWDLEVYRDRELVSATRAGPEGTYGVSLPARYGTNPFLISAYGPHGEVREFRRALLVTEDRLLAGRFEYGLSAGSCLDLLCRFQANGDARYGALPWLTLRAGVTYLRRDSLPSGAHPYLAITTAPHASFGFSTQGTLGGAIAGRAWFLPSPDFEMSLNHLAAPGRRPDPVLGLGGLHRRTQADVFWRPSRRDRAPFLRAQLATQASDHVRRQDAAVVATAPLSRARVELGVRYGGSRPTVGHPDRTLGLVTAGAVSLPQPAGLLHGAFLRAELAAAFDSGLTRAAVSVARQATHAVRIEADLAWRRSRGLLVGIRVATALRGIRAVHDAALDDRLGFHGQQMLEGSLLWDRRSRQLVMGDGRSLDRAGAAGVVYRDLNVNGARDPGEPGVGAVQVRIGPQAVLTDESGRFSTWDLVPFEPTSLEIDSLSLKDPLWVPAARLFSVRLSPNAFQEIALPLVPVGEITGRVSRGPRPVAGMQVRLLPDAGSTLETTTFGDGEFYFFGVRPGRYRLLLGDSPAAVRTLTFDPAGGARRVPYLDIALPN